MITEITKRKVNIFWFRRDLRINDNKGLSEATKGEHLVVPIFIFDTNILQHLNRKDDARVHFIHNTLNTVKKQLREHGSDLLVFYGRPQAIFTSLFEQYDINGIYVNDDYEPFARSRDAAIRTMATAKGIHFNAFKDHVIFSEWDIVTDGKKPYTIFTPYSKKWLSNLQHKDIQEAKIVFDQLVKIQHVSDFPSLESLGFAPSSQKVVLPNLSKELLKNYAHTRDDISNNSGTSFLSVHLRFGTVSTRELLRLYQHENPAFINELIWREFFQMLIFHFPQNASAPFKRLYNHPSLYAREDIQQARLEQWCEGLTGFDLVDAGMRQLKKTGYMHNRVRMLTANFLCKILHVNWQYGEAHFANYLLDFDLASNNGNWQWAAGCGCDASPYFRIFNPTLQQEKFDPQKKYINTWIDAAQHPRIPIVDYTHQRKTYLDNMKNVMSIHYNKLE